jgi:hypothetical protein
MITCPSCNHQNPDGSLQCENCYTPLPASTSCPNCGASVQTDATFCGQCGFNLQAEFSTPLEETTVGSLPDMTSEELSPSGATAFAENPEILPETAVSFPPKSPWDIEETEELSNDRAEPFPQQLPKPESTEMRDKTSTVSETEFMDLQDFTATEEAVPPQSAQSELDLEPLVPVIREEQSSEFEQPDLDEESSTIHSDASPSKTNAVSNADADIVASNLSGATQLQTRTSSLLHIQSNTIVEIPHDLDVVHLGKPNGQIPPDIDVSGFSDSEVVSRVHADIRIEGDAYFIEDVGSSNGTYINHAPLLRGNRHRLRAGDRIALGKGDLVSFIFQTS